jgi:dihydrolipoamide dehydrogenase
VTIVEMLPRIVPLEDEDVSAELEKAFKKRGIKTLTGHKVEAVETTKTGVKVTVSAKVRQKSSKPNRPWWRSASVPIPKDLGLEEVGVKISERGMVEIDDKMQTNVPGIYAIGDVTGKLMLAHVGFGDGHFGRRGDCRA